MTTKPARACAGNCRATSSCNSSPGRAMSAYGAFGLMLRLIAWISLIIGPIAAAGVLSAAIPALSRPGGLVVAAHRCRIDLILLWIVVAVDRARHEYLAPLARFPPRQDRWLGPVERRCRCCLCSPSRPSPASGCMSIRRLMRFVPTSWEKLNGTGRIGSDRPEIRIFLGATNPASLHELLVGGEVDDVAQRQKSRWSNRLVLPGIDLREHAKFDTKEKIDSRPTTLWLRKRQLENAILANAYLPKADFTGAELARMARSSCVRCAASGRVALIARSCRARRSMTRSCRARRSVGRSFRARHFFARSCRARRSIRRSCRARRSSGAAAGRVARSGAAAGRVARLERSCRARRSMRRSFRVRRSSTIFVWRAGRLRPLLTPPTLMSIGPVTERKYRESQLQIGTQSLRLVRHRPMPRCGGSSRTRFPRGDLRQEALARIAILDPEKKEELATAIWAELEGTGRHGRNTRKSSPKGSATSAANPMAHRMWSEVCCRWLCGWDLRPGGAGGGLPF